jgi:hypothetical protein
MFPIGRLFLPLFLWLAKMMSEEIIINYHECCLACFYVYSCWRWADLPLTIHIIKTVSTILCMFMIWQANLLSALNLHHECA